VRCPPSSSADLATDMITSLYAFIHSSAAFALAAAKPTHSKANLFVVRRVGGSYVVSG